MEMRVDKQFTWVIKNFSSLGSEKIYSDIFDVCGCKWRLSANKVYHGSKSDLVPFLEVVDNGSLPSAWRRNARCCLTVLKLSKEILTIIKITRSSSIQIQDWFDEKSTSCGFQSNITLNEINAEHSGLLVNGELKIDVEFCLLEVIGKVVVNGFNILPSQVEFVRRVFQKHPNLRAGYLSLLLSLIDTLCQPPHELNDKHLKEASAALKSLACVGFKLDWLEKKLDQVTEKKRKVRACEILTQETEMYFKGLTLMCSDIKTRLEKEKADMLAAKAPLSLDDVI